MSRTSAPSAVRWVAYFGVAAVFAVACAFLSHWQFGRNAERSVQLDLVAQNYTADPAPLQALIPEGSSMVPGDEWRPVTLTGAYLIDDQLLARNRAHAGTAAYELLVPFRLDDGRVFLVDRGWEPPGNTQPEPDSVPQPPAGEATVTVRLRPGESLPSSGRTAPDGQVPSIHLPSVAEALAPADAARFETSAYGLLVSEDPAPAAVPNVVEPPSDDPGPYLSYAVQWILFAVMGFVFIAYVIRSERRVRREDAEDAAAARAAADPHTTGPPASVVPRRRGRRPDRDTSDEDALLDRAGR